jgi:hypothetical protein
MRPHTAALLQRLALRVPRAVVFDEVGRAAMGPIGSGLVYCTIYLTILCEPIIFHITCMETLRQVRVGVHADTDRANRRAMQWV